MKDTRKQLKRRKKVRRRRILFAVIMMFSCLILFSIGNIVGSLLFDLLNFA